MNREERYNRERKVVENKMGFFIHLAVYVLVNFFVLIPNEHVTFLDGNLLPVVGWGIGLAVHFFKVFVFNENYIEKVVDRKMKNQQE